MTTNVLPPFYGSQCISDLPRTNHNHTFSQNVMYNTVKLAINELA